jgi:hypothetical protein
MGGIKRIASPQGGRCRKRRNAGLPMRVLLLGACLGVLLYGEDAGFIAPVVLITRFQVDPPPVAVISSVGDELADIMRPTGIHFEWRPLPTSERAEVAAQMVVVTFKGRCELSGMNTAPARSGVLGFTHVSGGVILPFTEVDCDGIRNLIERDLIIERPERQQTLYARAIARVLAHELYHILANTAKHGRCGLGKSTYRASDLLVDNFQFERRDLIAVQNGEIMANLKNPAHARRSAAVSARAGSDAAH